jgi:23S rRNA (cytidine1920-2'-O)/16S rRNA (cytidine1409-2'-O)-methyltransferase
LVTDRIPPARLDERLLASGAAESLAVAHGLILAGRVFVDGRRADKAGMRVAAASAVSVAPKPHPYVSRGGLKLEAALGAFSIEPREKIALDVGASTGGFTDCLLRAGAARVHAVDTGYGQMDAGLRADPRVVLHERMNARRLDRSVIADPIEVAAVDVSFISARLILPAVAPLLAPGARAVVLVKPQFEARRSEVRRGGIVDDGEVRARVVAEVSAAAEGLGLERLGVIESPIRGARGNVEFLLGLAKR